MGFENSFHMLSNRNPHMLKAFRMVAIESNLERANNFIQQADQERDSFKPSREKIENLVKKKILSPEDAEDHKKARRITLSEGVYSSLKNIRPLFYHLQGHAMIYMNDAKGKRQAYDHRVHSLTPFNSSASETDLVDHEVKESAPDAYKRNSKKKGVIYSLAPVPTKKVQMRISQFSSSHSTFQSASPVAP